MEASFFIGVVEKYRNRIEKATQRRSSLDMRSGKTPVDAARAWRKADRQLRVLSLSDYPTEETVNRATKWATVDFGNASVNEDTLARLLIGYRLVLERREGVPKRVVRAIDGKLLWLARDARKLSIKRHWELWADAVAAVGPRASHKLRRYVYHDASKKETDPAITKALNRAQRGLRRSGPPAVSVQAPTTQPG